MSTLERIRLYQKRHRIHTRRTVFVSVLAEVPDPEKQTPETDGNGVDLGIKALATVSDERVFANVNKTKEARRCREQRKLSRKYESLKKRNLKGEATRQNIQKQRLTVQRIYYRLDCIRTDFINKAVAELVKTKSAYIAMEDLNVRGMMKNRRLAKAVSEQKFYELRGKLTANTPRLVWNCVSLTAFIRRRRPVTVTDA